MLLSPWLNSFESAAAASRLFGLQARPAVDRSSSFDDDTEVAVMLILLGNALSLVEDTEDTVLLVNVVPDFDALILNLDRSSPDDTFDTDLLSRTELFAPPLLNTEETVLVVVNVLDSLFLVASPVCPGLDEPDRGLVVPDRGLMAPDRGLDVPDDEAVPTPPFLSSNSAFRSCTLAGLSGVCLDDVFRAVRDVEVTEDPAVKPVSRAGSAPVRFRFTPNGFFSMVSLGRFSHSLPRKVPLFYRWQQHPLLNQTYLNNPSLNCSVALFLWSHPCSC